MSRPKNGQNVEWTPQMDKRIAEWRRLGVTIQIMSDRLMSVYGVRVPRSSVYYRMEQLGLGLGVRKKRSNADWFDDTQDLAYRARQFAESCEEHLRDLKEAYGDQQWPSMAITPVSVPKRHY
jgi:hypothetical protein